MARFSNRPSRSEAKQIMRHSGALCPNGATLITFLLIGIVFFLTACTDSLGDRYVGFADCLTQKGVTMYGAYWCPHCSKQKKMFGKEAFRKIKYVECDPRGADANPELCLNKKIRGYPTWEFSDGSMVSGEQELSMLAEKTACALPAEAE